MSENEKVILEDLKRSIIEGNAEEAKKFTLKSLEKGIDPLQALDVTYEAIRYVGEKFEKGELFIPDLFMASEAMKSATEILTKEILKKSEKKIKTLGRIVIGTVAGDIHDIGKTIVSTMLMAAGFEVIDLGVDVSVEKFIEAVKKYQPDILAMSALLTATAPEQRRVIEALVKEGLRSNVKVIVGGGAITEDFAREIGADGYGATAIDAVELARRLLVCKYGDVHGI
jgi:corrinoid protein of di/trimethylamine methyltransferase